MVKRTPLFAFWAASLLFASNVLYIQGAAAQQLENVSVFNGIPPQEGSIPKNSYSNNHKSPILFNPSPLVASISSSLVDFGVIIAGSPVLRNTTITVFPGSAHGYQVTAFENHELEESTSGSVIPDTTCDNGSCNQNISAPWTDPLTYGFGYRCQIQNQGCNSNFSDPSTYMQFANLKKGEEPENIFSGTSNSPFDIIYKLNVPQTQSGKTFSNTVYYIISARI